MKKTSGGVPAPKVSMPASSQGTKISIPAASKGTHNDHNDGTNGS